MQWRPFHCSGEKLQNFICNRSSFTETIWKPTETQEASDESDVLPAIISLGSFSFCSSPFSPFLLLPSTRTYTLKRKPHTPVIFLEGIYLSVVFSVAFSSFLSTKARQRKENAEKNSWKESRQRGISYISQLSPPMPAPGWLSVTKGYVIVPM